MAKERRLGKGLEALLGAPIEDDLAPTTPAPKPRAKKTTAAKQEAAAPAGDNGLMYLSVYEIDDNPFQPRRDFSEPEIVSLAESIKEHEMLQPILVRKVKDRYQLISGERRLRAAIKAGLDKVPSRVREADDRLVAELAIVENMQRKDLNAIEKANSFHRYITEHQCTQDYLAKRLKIDRSTIANLVRLLDLPEPIQELVRKDEVSAGHAKALLPLGDEELQIDCCQRVLDEGMSVRAIEKLVRDMVNGEENPEVIPSPHKQKSRTSDEQLLSLEQDLKTALGAKVEVKQTKTGKGRIVIHFANSNEFERLFAMFLEEEEIEDYRQAG